MRDLVAGERDVGVFEEMRAEDVGEGMVLLVECEDRGIGRACTGQSSAFEVGRVLKGSCMSRTGV